MDQVEVPQHFICPISLQIMKDPVTAITGITYDRDSIEHWLFTANRTTCPVTKQPLPKGSYLTPNHTLRRLIQAWCNLNAPFAIPAPNPSLDKLQVINLLKNLHNPHLKLETLRLLEMLAVQNHRNDKYCLEEAGVLKAMINFLVACFRKSQIDQGLDEALTVLQFVEIHPHDIGNHELVLDSLTWVLGCEMENPITAKSHAIFVLKKIIENATQSVLERLKPEFLERIVKVLRNGITQEGMNAALHVLLRACPWGRNRIIMVEAGVVFELIEIEMGTPQKKTTELTLGILSHVCRCAEGRAQFISHKGGIAVLTERILKVSLAVDDRAVFVVSLISKFCGTTHTVIQEMLEVGTATKLCTLLQVDHPEYLKHKARDILKSHSEAWKSSPCFPGHSFYASFHR